MPGGGRGRKRKLRPESPKDVEAAAASRSSGSSGMSLRPNRRVKVWFKQPKDEDDGFDDMLDQLEEEMELLDDGEDDEFVPPVVVDKGQALHFRLFYPTTHSTKF